MKTIIALSVVAALAMAPAAQAGGFLGKSGGGNILSNLVGITGVNVLNGTTVAVGNNSSILNNIGSGNGILGIGGQNSTTTTNVNSNNQTTHNVNSFNKGGKKRW